MRACYKGLEKDLKELKEEGRVRSILSQKEIVLFPIDKSLDKIEVRHKIPPKAAALICSIWESSVSIVAT